LLLDALCGRWFVHVGGVPSFIIAGAASFVDPAEAPSKFLAVVDPPKYYPVAAEALISLVDVARVCGVSCVVVVWEEDLSSACRCAGGLITEDLFAEWSPRIEATVPCPQAVADLRYLPTQS